MDTGSFPSGLAHTQKKTGESSYASSGFLLLVQPILTAE